jgi:hypothetical protein
VRFEYLEKRGDQVLFFGTPLTGDVWISDIFFHQEDGGGVEGRFQFLLTDPAGATGGCRVLLDGHFVTNPSPSRLRQRAGLDPDTPSDEVYVDAGCSGDVVIVDDGESCDCGGDDTSTSGCEGDTGDSSGCEGDSGGSGCEGDSGGSGCEGDAGGGDCGGGGSAGCSGGGGGCEGIARAAVAPPKRASWPLRTFTRFLPEIGVLLLITWWRRKLKANS